METITRDVKENDKKLRGRFMHKLFKDKKEEKEDLTTPQEDVDEFLHGPSDKLHMMPVGNGTPVVPPLTRLDTASARRWPTAAEVQTSQRMRNPRPSRKGLTVRFSNDYPEIIGEGGDDVMAPVTEISSRRRAHTHPRVEQPVPVEDFKTRSDTNPDQRPTFAERMAEKEPFMPGPIRRTQTGYESIPSLDDRPPPPMPEESESRAGPGPLQLPDLTTPGDRRSFADMVKDDMRSGEGLALVKGTSAVSPLEEQLARAESPGAAALSVTPQMELLQINTMNNQHIPIPSPAVLEFSHPPTPNIIDTPPQYSNESAPQPTTASHLSTSNHLPRSLQVSQDSYEHPASSRSSPISLRAGHYDTNHLTESPATLSRTGTLSLQDAVVAVGDDALREFSKRTAHLITLFRLSMEAFKPLPKCSLEELVRAALWWFIRGRLNIESTIRDRPASPQAQQTHFLLRQQAYADLTKALWLVETVAAQFPEAQLRPGSADSAPNSPLGDILECRQNVLSSLRKLTMSMQRNKFLPPDVDEAPLTQGLDASIWVQDEGNRSLITSQRSMSALPLSEALPLGDTSRTFQFVRMFAEANLVEDAASQHYRFPALVTVVRGQREQKLTAVVASQDGSINMTIQTDKRLGPTWDDVRWVSKQQLVEVYLPRGFVLRLQCTELNFRALWNVWDYEQQTQAMLERREGEQIIFETILKNFQYFDQNSQTVFPKEPQPQCLLRIFEKTVVKKEATGPRTLHRGYRLALNTSPKTKNLRGIDQEFVPTMPVLFGLLRGEGGMPALLLKVDDGRVKYTMVATFDNVTDRTRLHNLLSGLAVRAAEGVVAKSQLKGFSITHSAGDMKCFQAIEWNEFSFINQNYGGDLQASKTVLSEQLRVIMYSKVGTFTDRINVEPGELKYRLSVNDPNQLKVLRQPQQDVTLSIAEASVPKDLQRDLAKSLDTLASVESTRTYTFPTIAELHLFQAAMTGFVVLFDTVASSFNISRRRMVVPIYKKWDAATTRLQIVQKEKVIQLVAFFEGFTHGDCMNFTLKSTDIFETSGRSGKYSVRIVDAKFAMPKARQGETSVDHEYVSLDMPDYPGEHDDITIIFDSEANRDEFTKALPAPVKVASRMGSVRR